MVMDSLRYWVEHVHIDGFRFDLASVLGREAHGFDPQGGFFDAIRQDPVLAKVKLIAEPWDIGPGGYQLGAYPPPVSYTHLIRCAGRQGRGASPPVPPEYLGQDERTTDADSEAGAGTGVVCGIGMCAFDQDRRSGRCGGGAACRFG